MLCISFVLSIRLFPVKPSEEDVKLDDELKELQNLSYQSFEVKDHCFNKNLCQLAIEGITSPNPRTKES